VHDTHHIERGYGDLPGHLAALGADVTRTASHPREDLRD